MSWKDVLVIVSEAEADEPAIAAHHRWLEANRWVYDARH